MKHNFNIVLFLLLFLFLELFVSAQKNDQDTQINDDLNNLKIFSHKNKLKKSRSFKNYIIKNLSSKSKKYAEKIYRKKNPDKKELCKFFKQKRFKDPHYRNYLLKKLIEYMDKRYNYLISKNNLKSANKKKENNLIKNKNTRYTQVFNSNFNEKKAKCILYFSKLALYSFKGQKFRISNKNCNEYSEGNYKKLIENKYILNKNISKNLFFSFMINYDKNNNVIIVSFAGPEIKPFDHSYKKLNFNFTYNANYDFLKRLYSTGLITINYSNIEINNQNSEISIEKEFKEIYYDKMRIDLIAWLQKYIKNQNPAKIIFTGYGLGGSLGLLAFTDLMLIDLFKKSNKPEAYIFAGFRIGDENFIEKINKISFQKQAKIWRIYNDNDYVVKFPNCYYNNLLLKWQCDNKHLKENFYLNEVLKVDKFYIIKTVFDNDNKKRRKLINSQKYWKMLNKSRSNLKEINKKNFKESILGQLKNKNSNKANFIFNILKNMIFHDKTQIKLESKKKSNYYLLNNRRNKFGETVIKKHYYSYNFQGFGLLILYNQSFSNYNICGFAKKRALCDYEIKSNEMKCDSHEKILNKYLH